MKKSILFSVLVVGATLLQAQSITVHQTCGQNGQVVKAIPPEAAQAVDLGLSVKWANMNVGAESPEGYGDYFAWGETAAKATYDWSTYFDTNDGGNTFTKYNNEGGKTVLAPEDDAAHVHWGGSWRMPTPAEWQELIDNCTWAWTTQNGINGYKVTSYKAGYTDKFIFLPAAGCRDGSGLRLVGSEGYYWSSSLSENDSYGAWNLGFYSVGQYLLNFYRFHGLSVRPVQDDKPAEAVQAVDLGLSVKWANMNVGAESPEDYGNYYAWGETSAKANYGWSTYFDTNDGGSTFTKYNNDGGKTLLDPEDDAAHVNWGGSWRMPTKAEWQELIDNCTWTWTTQNGINVYKVTSNKAGYTDKFIFLPAAGERDGSDLYGLGSYGFYWSSSLYESYSDRPWGFGFNSGGHNLLNHGCRGGGQSVRPVQDDRPAEAAQAVDLGLSVKWANMNVGAEAPEDYGNYYAWGETSTKETYSWDTYFDTNDGGHTFAKYNNEGGKTVLDPEDDAAHVNWGGSWRMPTKAEWQELIDNCTWTWTTQNGINGYKVTSNKAGYTDKFIFLPAAGSCGGSDLGLVGSYGYFCSSSLDENNSLGAWGLSFGSGARSLYGLYRSYGQSVRPVLPQTSISYSLSANDTIRIYSNRCDDYQTFIGPHGGQLTMTANSDQWSHFVRWNDGNTDNPRTITTNGNADYTAYFEADSCLLASGTCGAQGDNLTWELSCDSVLTVSGTGEMGDDAPWLSDYKEQINAVIIADGVTSIGRYAFQNCSSLTSVTIPNSVTTIGKFAFCNCTSLSSLTIPASVTQIEGHFVSQVSDSHYNLIMGSNNITQLSVEEGNPVYDSRGNCNAIIETATNTLLVGCQNTVIPNTVTRIGYCAFYQCATLTSIDIPSSVTKIGVAAFGETGLTNIILPHNVTIECPSPYADYYFGAFGACRELTSVEFAYGEGGSVSIGNNTFSDCDKLNNITLPNNVTDIGNYAFLRCSGLNNIIIPGSVTSIGEGAFSSCSDLTTVTNYATTPQTINNDVFQNVDKSIPLYVPAESIDAYKAADGWKEFTNILPIGGMDIDHPTNPGTYQLTLNASIADAGVLTGAGMYAQGTEVSVSATANTGYTFERWSDGVTDASRTIILVKDSTLTAIFSINHYTVTFVDEDGTTVLASDEYEYGATPVAPANPTKAATAQYTYTFNGWSPAIATVTEAATYTATYSQTVNKYTVTFMDEDGTTVLASAEYEYGATPVAPADPSKAATAQYTYIFTGWSPAIATVTGAATYTATYSQTVNKYTVTFVDEDGTTILASAEYEYGATPVAPADPSKAATAQYTYTFTGWSPAIANVTGTATYTATYSQTVNKYTITFMDEDGTTVLASAEYEYGATPVAPADPTKSATEEYTYTFSGWDKTIAVVTEAATYTATYSSQLNNVAVTGDQDLADLPVGENTHITVGEDGNLTVSEPTTIGTITVTVNGDEASEITGVENLTVTNAEMILRLEPNKANATPNKWYAFGVPFEVEVSGGIYAQGSASPAIYNSAFVLDEYDGSLRASTQQGWKRVSSSAVLQPGVLYMIAIGSTTNEWRFVKRASASLTEQTSLSVAAYPSAIGNHHAGWNGLVNTLFRDASVALDGVQYITTYNNEQSVYEVQPIADATLAMAKPFFVQVPQAGTMYLTAQPAGVAARSLMAADEQSPSCVLSLSSVNFTDRAYITAQVGKQNTYSIGHDLMKMLDGTPSVPQLWLEGYNLRLAAYELALTSESTTFIIPLGLYAPQNGTYTLDADTQSDYYTLTLLADDTPVAELGEQAVSIDLEQGNNSKYALRITKKADVVTDIVNGTADDIQVVKFVQDDLLYILRDGKTYTTQGQEVR